MRTKSRIGPPEPAKQRTLSRSAAFIAGLCLGGYAHLVSAGPTGGEVVHGEGSITQSGATTTVNQSSQRIILEWQTFDVAADEHVIFDQPNTTAIALNRIFDQNPSQIFGAIDANGRVFLINPNGLLFGETARVNVAALVASSLDIAYDDFLAGNYDFAELAGSAGGIVVNRGLLQAATGGSVTLMGGAVRNTGLIVAELGQVTLAAGSSASLDFDGNGLIFFEVTGEVLQNAGMLDSAVDNSGEINADGGEVLLTAEAAQNVFSNVVNHTGIIRAQRIDDSGGVIRLVGSGGDVLSSGVLDASGAGANDLGGTVHVLGDRVALHGDASIDVSGDSGGGTALIGGDYQGGNPEIQNASRTYVGGGTSINADANVAGHGGEVIVWADEVTRFYGDITARGGSDGGDGGFVEVSGKEDLVFAGGVDTSAVNGSSGLLLLDPDNIDIVNADGGADDGLAGDGEVTFADAPADATISEQTLEGLAAATDISLQATNSIEIQDLADDELTLLTDGSVEFRTGAGGFTVVDVADVVNVTGTGSLTIDTIGASSGGTGDGAITTGGLQTNGGAITLNGTDIDVGGEVLTAGGDFNANADATFDSTGITIDTTGAVDTNGGDVNIVSFNPLTAGNIVTAGGTDTNGDGVGNAGGTVTLSGSSVTVGAINTTGSAAAVNGGAGGAIVLTGTDGDSPTIALNGDIDTSGGAGTTQGAGGDVTFNGRAELNGSRVIDTGATAGNVIFNDRVDGTTDFADDLTVTAGAGNVAFNDVVGVTTVLGDVNVTSANDVTLGAEFNASSLTVNASTFDSSADVIDTSGDDDAAGGAVEITTTGQLTAGDIFTAGGADALDTTGHAAGDVTLSGGNVSVGEIIATGSAATTGTNPGGAGGVVALSANAGVITLNGDIDTSGGGAGAAQGAGGSVTFNDPLVLTGTRGITTGATAGDVLFANSVEGTTGFADGLTVTAGTGNVTFNDAIGTGTTPLGDLVITSANDVDIAANVRAAALTVNSGSFDAAGTINTIGASDTAGGLVAITTTGQLTAGDIATIGGADALDTTGHAAGDVTLSGGNVAVGEIIATGSAATTGTNAGGAGGVVALTANAGTITLDGDIDTSGGGTGAAQGAGGSVTFNDPVVLTNTRDITTGATAGDVTFADSVVGTTGFADDLTVTAGTGNVAFNGAVGTDATPLGDLVITSANDVDIAADVRAAALTVNSGSFDSSGFEIDTSGVDEADGGDVEITTGGTLDAGSITTVGGADSGLDGGHAGGAVTLAGTTVTAGTISTFGSSDGGAGGLDGAGGSIAVSSTAGAALGDVDAGDGTVAIAIDLDNDQAATLTVGDVTSTGVISFTGGTDGNDTLQINSSNAVVAWNVNGVDSGTAASGTFTNFANLQGGAQSDQFVFEGELTGDALGGLGDDRFTVNVNGDFGTAQGQGGSDAFTVNADFTGTADGGDGSDAFTVNADFSGTAQGGNDLDTFTLASDFTGTADGGAGDDRFNVQASMVTGTAQGGDGDDSFALSPGVSAGAGRLDGGNGSDTVLGDAGSSSTFTVAAADVVQVQNGGATATVQDVENATGGGEDDVFVFNSTLAGDARGGLGNDQFTVNAGGGFDEAQGEGGTDTFTLASDFTGTAEGGADDDTFHVQASLATGTAQGGAGNDTFVLSPGVSAGAGRLDGGDNTDTVRGDASSSSTFTVAAADVVQVQNGGATATVQDVENATGGDADDVFVFNSSLAGDARGGLGNDQFTVNAGGAFDEAQGEGGTDTFTLASDFTGTAEGGADDDTFHVEASLATGTAQGGAGNDTFVLSPAVSAGAGRLDAGDGSDTVLGDPGSTSTFRVTATDTVDVQNGGATATMQNVENVTGGNENDTFEFLAGLTGTASGGSGSDQFRLLAANVGATVEGGAGADELVASDTATTFTVDADDAGEATAGAGTVAFNDLENLTGGSGNDTFNLQATLTGTASGGAGGDTFRFQGSGLAATARGGAGNDEFIVEGVFNGSAEGEGGDDLFDLATSTDADLHGGGGDDTFRFADGVVAGGVLDGGAGSGDSLDLSAYASSRSVTLTASNADGYDGTESSVASGFTNIDRVQGSATGGDTLTGLDAAATWDVAGDGSAYTSGGVSLGFGGFETLNGGSNADTFRLGGGAHTGDLVLAGNGGNDSAAVVGDLDVSGDLTIGGVESLTGGTAGTLSAAVLTIDGAVGGIGTAANRVQTDVTTVEITNAGGVFLSETSGMAILGIDSAGAIGIDAGGAMTAQGAITANGTVTLEVDGSFSQNAGISSNGGDIEVEGTSITMADGVSTSSAGASTAGDISYLVTGAGDIVIGLLDAGVNVNAGDGPTDTPAIQGSGDVTVTSNNGDILDGNGDEVNVRGASAALFAPEGSVGTDDRPITVIVPRIEGQTTITLNAIEGAILNPNLATVSVPNLDLSGRGQRLAVGASVVSALEEIGFVDWAGLDPDVRLVDCLEPCIKLPPDQLEDPGLAKLREPSKMLVIRTASGTTLVPVYLRAIGTTTAIRPPEVAPES